MAQDELFDVPAATEKDIQNAILRELASRPNLRIWRQNVGVAVPLTAAVRAALEYVPHSVVAFGLPGAADLSGILADGRRLEIEIKTERGAQSKQQQAYERMITKFGGAYILARGIDDIRGIS